MRSITVAFITIITFLVFVQTVGVLYVVKQQNVTERTRYEATKQAVKDAMAEAYFAE